jgi:hypothetical protein
MNRSMRHWRYWRLVRTLPNLRLQRTALRVAADPPNRWADQTDEDTKLMSTLVQTMQSGRHAPEADDMKTRLRLERMMLLLAAFLGRRPR